MTNRGHRDRLAVVASDDTLGRVTVRRDPARPWVRVLQVDGHAYGAVDLQDPGSLELEYLALLGAVTEALLPAGPCHLLHLGGGAFALPRALAARRPELHQTVVEFSAVVIRLAERELGLEQSLRLAVHHDDARHAVERTPTASADLVVGDAFVGRQTPAHLTTAEFVADVARVLRPRGAYIVNLIDGPPWSIVGTQAATIRTALPHVVAVGSPAVADLRASGNMLLVASRRPLHRGGLQWRVRHAPRTIEFLSGARLTALASVARPRHDADGCPSDRDADG
jgi:spermidine synthase